MIFYAIARGLTLRACTVKSLKGFYSVNGIKKHVAIALSQICVSRFIVVTLPPCHCPLY
jgi:hypothetical protein